MSIRPRSLRPGTAVAVLGLAVLSSCVVNPATGGRQFTLMSEGQEIQMGRDADPGIVASMGIYADEDLQEYVQDLGLRLAARAERPNLPWTFRVLDDPLVNAFALPGGYIYVTRGIMAYLESEAELVGILGHEIGHVTARHSVDQISRAQLAQVGLGVGMILAPGLQRFEGIANASLGLLFLKFGRDDERQADELGVRYMGRLGYDPTRLAGVMQMLSRVTASSEGGGVPEWLSTHPNPENREGAILEMSGTADVAEDPPRVERDAYLSRLEGLVLGDNPREGYFQGSEFFHPELRFRVTFPAGWRTANQRQAVQALSPQEDALMALTAGEGTNPGQAVRAFLDQEGVQGRGINETIVNGLNAAWADFRYEDPENRIDGRFFCVLHDGTLFQIMGYGTPGAWPQQSGATLRAMESFQPLTDPAHLNVRPARIRLVTVPGAMTLEAFLAREGAADRAEEVRMLNRLEGNPSLAAGRRLKIPSGGRLPGGN